VLGTASGRGSRSRAPAYVGVGIGRAMSQAQTRPIDADVGAFLDRIEPAAMRADCRTLNRLMAEVTGENPTLWGGNIIGFGSYHYHYRYASGRDGNSPLVRFSPRKPRLTLYLIDGFDHDPELLARLGKHTTGKACL